MTDWTPTAEWWAKVEASFEEDRAILTALATCMRPACYGGCTRDHAALERFGRYLAAQDINPPVHTTCAVLGCEGLPVVNTGHTDLCLAHAG